MGRRTICRCRRRPIFNDRPCDCCPASTGRLFIPLVCLLRACFCGSNQQAAQKQPYYFSDAEQLACKCTQHLHTGSFLFKRRRQRHCFILYALIRRTGVSAFRLTIIIKEMPQNYNNYIQALREKEGIDGRREGNSVFQCWNAAFPNPQKDPRNPSGQVFLCRHTA
jgi:hypothetical protein